MDSHLDFEDEYLVPLFGSHFTGDEYTALTQAAMKHLGIGKQAAFTVPFVMYWAAPADRDKLIAEAPLPFRVAVPRDPQGPRSSRRAGFRRGGRRGGAVMRLARFATTMVRRRRLVVAVWAVILVAAAVAAGAAGANHRVDYTMPGSGSARAQELLGDRFPELSGDTVQLVFATNGPDTLDAPSVATRVADLQDQARRVEHVSDVRIDAFSPDRNVALATVQLDATAEKVPARTIEELMSVADGGNDPALGLTVEAGGGAVQTVEMGESGSEGIGLAAALIILLVVFGSVLAAGLPILVAVFGLGVGLSVGDRS